MKKIMKGKILSVFSVFFASSIILISCAGDDRYNNYDELEYIQPTTNFQIASVDGLTVTFTNSSTDAVAYSWDFGDDIDADSEGTEEEPLLNDISVFTEANPTYTYAEGGTYTVTLTTASEEGFTTTSELEFSFVGAAFSTSIEDLTVTFENQSTNAESFSWDFDNDGVVDSTEENPTYVYPEGGFYTVVLMVTDSAGNPDSSESEVIVTGEEVASFQYALVTDTSDADTGELRLELTESIAKGMMTVTFSKEVTSQDAFINLSGTSTSRANAMIDMRIDDANGYEFTESGTSTNAVANFPAFVNDEFTDVVITWDSTVAGSPVVTVTIGGQAVTTEAFVTESGDLTSVADGVKNVQFRLGGGSALDASGAGLLIDDLKVFDTSSGTAEIVFEDDFEDYTAGDSLDPDDNADSSYHSNSFEAIIESDSEVVVDDTSSLKALVTDTSDADTGELRIELDASIAKGTMTVTFSKEVTSQDAFINLSGTSTSRANAMIDMRIDDANGYEFTESGTSTNAVANFPAFVNDEFTDVVITWDSTVAGSPVVTVTIGGQAVTTEAFVTESGDLTSVADGVKNVQFRLGGGSALDASGAGLLIDDLKVYDTSSGTAVIVFEDDFEGYTVGDSLDPDDNADSPYHSNSFEATIVE